MLGSGETHVLRRSCCGSACRPPHPVLGECSLSDGRGLIYEVWLASAVNGQNDLAWNVGVLSRIPLGRSPRLGGTGLTGGVPLLHRTSGPSDRLPNLGLGEIQESRHHGPVAELGAIEHSLVQSCLRICQRGPDLVHRLLLVLPTLHHGEDALMLFEQSGFQLGPPFRHCSSPFWPDRRTTVPLLPGTSVNGLGGGDETLQPVP